MELQFHGFASNEVCVPGADGFTVAKAHGFAVDEFATIRTHQTSQSIANPIQVGIKQLVSIFSRKVYR